MCVSLRFNATAAQLAQVRTAFSNGSQVFADATDNQQRFGTITLVNNSGATQSSEYWVNSGTGRAYATFGRYGVRGEHVNLFMDSNFQQTNGANGDAYTVAHEHAHHAFGIADEYSGPAGDAECAPTPDTATLNFSLMDNYFTRGGQALGDVYTLNEFCTAANHDPDADTYQQSRNAQSSWETIVAHATRSAVAPAGLPVDAAPGAHTVTFRDGTGALRVMMLVDRSGSMAFDQRIEFARLGARQFTGFFAAGDSAGLASFATNASVDFSLSDVTPGNITSLNAAIDALNPTDATNIGGGLLAALGQLTAQTNRSCNEVIVLLSDGDHNTGTSPASVLDTLQDEGVTVMTVGVGAGISTAGQATLQTVATTTGGRYFRVADAAGLTSLMTQLAAETTGSGLLTRSPDVLSPGASKSTTTSVEPGAASATFVLIPQAPGAPISLTVTSPSGTVIDANTAPTLPNVVYSNANGSIKVEVALPQAGVWTMTASAGAVLNGNFELLSFARNDGVALNVAIDRENVAYPQAVVVEATPTFGGEAVIGASIQGIVNRPEGGPLSIQLFDDGLPAHGDTIAGDGVYSVRFNSYQGEGTYTFELQGTTSNGTTYAGEQLHAGEPPNSKAVPDFVRTASLSAVVSGVPQFITGTVEYGPETINLKSSGTVVTAYIELPAAHSVQSIDPGSLKITSIDGVSITPIAALSKPRTIGDVDQDGVADLMAKFPRAALQAVLKAGTRTLRLEGTVSGAPFVAVRSVGVKN